MSKYGEAAVLAVEKAHSGLCPKAAWTQAVWEVFPKSPTGREKGCPRAAFLGLAEEGLVQGIPGGCYTRSKDNKKYALQAVELLRSYPELSRCPGKMWTCIMRGQKKEPNQQMDIVSALWNKGYIVTKTGV